MSGEPTPATVDLVFRDAVSNEPLVDVAAEVADDEQARTRGLSGRPCMQADWVLVSTYPAPDRVAVQTRTMRYPIDIAFLDTDRTVVSVARRVSPSGELVTADQAVQYVIEAPAGALDAIDRGDIARW